MRKRCGGLAVAALVASAGFFATANVASAQVYPPVSCSIGLSTSASVAGGQVTLTGTNFPTGPVSITFDGQLVATATAASDFTVTFTIPANAAPGSHTVVASSASGTCAASSVLTTTAVGGIGTELPAGGAGTGTAVGGASSGALAFTGASPLGLVLFALVCITIGCSIVFAVRRRAQLQRRFSS